MINLTVEEALSFVPTLRELMGLKLPIKAAYKLARFARLTEDQLQDFQKQRIALINEMGEKGETGGFVVPEAKMEEFMAKLKDILPEGLSVAADTLALSDFGDTAALTPQQLVALERYKLLKV